MKGPDFHKILSGIQRLNKRERFTLYLAVCALALVLFDRLIVNPIAQNMQSLDQQIVEKERLIKKDLHVLSQKDRIAAEAKAYSVFVNAPASEDEAFTQLLKEIEALANTGSVSLLDMKPGGSKDMGPHKQYTVNVVCEGTMEKITSFLYAIESSTKVLKVQRYQITPKSRESTVAQCTMSITQIVMPK